MAMINGRWNFCGRGDAGNTFLKFHCCSQPFIDEWGSVPNFRLIEHDSRFKWFIFVEPCLPWRPRIMFLPYYRCVRWVLDRVLQVDYETNSWINIFSDPDRRLLGFLALGRILDWQINLQKAAHLSVSSLQAVCHTSYVSHFLVMWP